VKLVARVLLSLVLVAGGMLLGIAITRGISSNPDLSEPAAVPPDPTGVLTGDATAPLPAATGEPAAPATNAGATTAPPATGVPATAVGADFTRVAEQAVKAVVNISSVSIVRAPSSPFANDPFFRQFFGEDPFTRERRSASLGSGVIVSPDGYIVTNGHVLGQGRAREVTVALADKRELPGQVVGIDTATDIALLKVDARDLPVVPWGDSNRLQIGEWVLAIGSPFSLSQTVTAGIISATGRANLGFAAYEDFIQTDAAINPGNSGGALVSVRGDLVGINTGIFSQSGGYQGIGFAVPSLLAQRIVNDLAEYGEVRRGFIEGLAIAQFDQRIARELGYAGASNVIINQLSRDAAIYKAGAQPGDIIVAFNGTPVTSPSQLFRLVADAPIGSPATMTLFREGKTLDVTVPVVASRQMPRR
jgi:Do/DeqQ family serine protease